MTLTRSPSPTPRRRGRDPAGSLETIKRKVHGRQHGLNYRHQRIFLGQNELRDGTVASNGITPNAMLHLLMSDEDVPGIQL